MRISFLDARYFHARLHDLFLLLSSEFGQVSESRRVSPGLGFHGILMLPYLESDSIFIEELCGITNPKENGLECWPNLDVSPVFT